MPPPLSKNQGVRLEEMIEKRKAALEVIGHLRANKFISGVAIASFFVVFALSQLSGILGGGLGLAFAIAYFGWQFFQTQKKIDYLTIKYKLNFLQPEHPMQSQQPQQVSQGGFNTQNSWKNGSWGLPK